MSRSLKAVAGNIFKHISLHSTATRRRRRRRRKMMENLLQPGRQQEKCVRMCCAVQSVFETKRNFTDCSAFKTHLHTPRDVKSGELGATYGCLE